METKSHRLDKKIEVARNVLQVPSVSALVDKLLSAAGDADKLQRTQQNASAWVGGTETRDTMIFERFKTALCIDSSVPILNIMACTPAEFFDMLPVQAREVVRASAGNELTALLEDEPLSAMRNRQGFKLNGRPLIPGVQDRVRAALELFSTIEAIQRSPISRREARPAFQNRVSWEVSKALHDYVGVVAGEPQVVLMIVGPSPANRAANFDRPHLLAATGRTEGRLNGRDASKLGPFLDSSTGTITQPPPSAPPTGPRVELARGLIVQAWSPEETFPTELVEELDFQDGARGDYFFFPQSAIGDHHSMYLELSKNTKSVYLFRVVAPEVNARMLVTADFLNSTQLAQDHCHFVMEALRRTLSITASSSGRA